MNITKVKHDGTRTHIEWMRGDPDEPDNWSMNSKEHPRQELKDALGALKPHVCDICELPDEWAQRMEVRGVSFSWARDIMGACITAFKNLENSDSPLVLNTPHKPSSPYSETGDDKNCLSAECQTALENVLNEAELYVKGQRAQGSLFGVEDEAERGG